MAISSEAQSIAAARAAALKQRILDRKQIALSRAELIANLTEMEQSPTGSESLLALVGMVDDIQTGMDTSDATAISDDILLGETAYVDGAKVTGTMPDNSNTNVEVTTISGSPISEGYHDGNGVAKLSDSEAAKVIAENIKSGVTILGVSGALESLDVSDATANALDILSGKTAYVGGGYDADVVSLLHMEGANDGTTFTDEEGNTWSSNGGKTATSQKKFGNTSMYLQPVTGFYVSTTDVADFNFGSGDWTLDFWLRPSNITNGTIVTRRESSGDYWAIVIVSGNIRFDYWNQSAPELMIATDTTPMELDVWKHVAIERDGASIRIFVDGVEQTTTGTQIGTTDLATVSGGTFRLGSSSNYGGYIDEFRASKGVARYTADFAPPLVAYTTAGIKVTGTLALVVDHSPTVSVSTSVADI